MSRKGQKEADTEKESGHASSCATRPFLRDHRRRFHRSRASLPLGEARHRNSTQGQAPGHVVQRGEYLVKIMGCNDCHTPWKMGPQGPEPDMTRFLSGHPERIGPLPNETPAAPFVWPGSAQTPPSAGRGA